MTTSFMRCVPFCMPTSLSRLPLLLVALLPVAVRHRATEVVLTAERRKSKRNKDRHHKRGQPEDCHHLWRCPLSCLPPPFLPPTVLLADALPSTQHYKATAIKTNKICIAHGFTFWLSRIW